MIEDSRTTWKTFTEEIEVTGHQLVEQVTRLLAEGNVRQLQIRSESGDVYVAVPLAAGAIVGGVVVLAAPWLAIIGTIAGRTDSVLSFEHSVDLALGYARARRDFLDCAKPLHA